MAVPESIDPDYISVTVKALIDHDFLAGLVEVLVKDGPGWRIIQKSPAMPPFAPFLSSFSLSISLSFCQLISWQL